MPFVFWNYSTKFTDYVPNYYLIIAGACFYWFSIFDMMDGTRARRLKCGSPLGRIVDEGNLIYNFKWSVNFVYYIASD